jgi:hypothetical protein
MDMNTGPQIFLLTATIAPLPGINNLTHVDPVKRLRDYEIALEYYLRLRRPNDQFVFCENSGSDLSTLKQIADRMRASNSIEFLGFRGNDFPPTYGRGYGEFKMIDHAMSVSEKIGSASPLTPIWKITGRYIVENLLDIVDSRPFDASLYCNYRDYPKKGWMDLYLMSWTREFYQKNLAGVYLKLIDDPDGRPVTAEHLMREHLDEIGFSGPFRFKKTPKLTGTRGSDGGGYHNSGRKKYIIRRAMLSLAPWIWV